MRILLFLLIFSLHHTIVYSQVNETNLQEIYNKAEHDYGPDDRLISGKLYFPLHKLQDEHPFFKSKSFFKATIYINENIYMNIPLKYDMEQQKMIIEVSNDNSVEIIEVIPERINSIVFDNKKFKFSTMISPLLEDENYYELFWEEGFIYIISRNLIFDPLKNRNEVISGGYKKLTINRYILTDNKIYTVNSKRSFLNLAKKKKKEIKKFMKENKIKYNKLSEKSHKSLMQFCYEKKVF